MDFPPVINLVSATFDGLNNRPADESKEHPKQAPQPVADSAGSEGLGANSGATSGTNRVGTVLNASA